MRETDSQLVHKTLNGDHSAFDELVHRYRNRAYRSAVGIVAIPDDAVDIAQEAFVRAYMSLRSLNDPERFAPWLMVIVRNLCVRRLRHVQEVVLLQNVEDTVCAPTPDAVSEEIYEAFNALPDGTRAAATMYFVEGMRQTEIVQRLDISLPAVKARIRDARARLQKEMLDMSPRHRKDDALGEEFANNLQHKLELARWYGVIAEHLESGGDVMTGLRAICRGGYSPRLMDATGKMIDAMEAGRSFRDAVAEIPALASPEALAMAHAGEALGNLHIAVRCLTDWMDVQDTQRYVEVIFWCRTFGFLLSAGVQLDETLDYSLGIARGKALQQATRDMTAAISSISGTQPTSSPLRPVLDKYTDIFPPILRAAILAGEASGVLDLALFWAADEMADDLAYRIARPMVPSPRKLTPRQFGIRDVTEILPEPCLRLVFDPAPDIRAAAIDILGRLGYKQSAPTIADCLEDESVEVRRTAARVVADMEYREAAEALVRRLSDEDPLVRRAAIESITRLDLHSAAQDIAEAIRDLDHRVISTAIDSLRALHEEEVMKQRAVEMFGSESWEDQKRAAYLLRYFLPQEVVQGLVDQLAAEQELSLQEMSSVIALGLYGCIQARLILNELVKDSRVAERTARALQYSGDATSAAAIRESVERGILNSDYCKVADEIEAK